LFYRAPQIIACRQELENDVIGGKLSATLAVQRFIHEFDKVRSEKQTGMDPFGIGVE
jgi:LAO/AO transport system kinase